MRKWRALIVLSLAQFLMVLDSAVMNVSISQLVEDFDTTGQIYERMAVVSDVIQPVYDEINKKYGLNEKQD